uniref:Zinc transport protein ZntB n=1 Tax=Anthurium amnicola TaxID=1678845 RepID=A0A1D1YEJ6_9ARAE
MELIIEKRGSGTEEMGRQSSAEALLKETRLYQKHFPGVLKKYAYRFDGSGNYSDKDWDLEQGRGRDFCWYHVELPKGDQKLSKNAQYLIDVLCPPLKLHEILALVSNGPYCGHVDQALVFRVNSPGPPASDFTIRLAVRVTENSVITVSLGRIPRLGFSRSRIPLLKDVPSVGNTSYLTRDEVDGGSAGTVIDEHLLEFLLRMDHSEEADNPVPTTVSNLVVHIIDTYVDHVHDIVTNLEMDLDGVELELDKGGFTVKKQMLDDRRFPKMHLNLQRLLQVVAHGEQVFPRVKEKLATKSWFANEDILSLEELIGRLRRLKENLGFIVNRVTAIQTGLDSWQAEQINRKLYYLSFLSMIFLPMSIITGIFGMNVGGVPWTGQRDPSLEGGFRNVLFICAAMLLFLLFCFSFPSIYTRVSAWRRRQSLKKSYSLNRKSFLKRTVQGNGTRERDYTQI